jgi:hypothetical protein
MKHIPATRGHSPSLMKHIPATRPLATNKEKEGLGVRPQAVFNEIQIVNAPLATNKEEEGLGVPPGVGQVCDLPLQFLVASAVLRLLWDFRFYPSRAVTDRARSWASLSLCPRNK